jgi:hypothetical protein
LSQEYLDEAANIEAVVPEKASQSRNIAEVLATLGAPMHSRKRSRKSTPGAKPSAEA